MYPAELNINTKAINMDKILFKNYNNICFVKYIDNKHNIQFTKVTHLKIYVIRLLLFNEIIITVNSIFKIIT